MLDVELARNDVLLLVADVFLVRELVEIGHLHRTVQLVDAGLAEDFLVGDLDLRLHARILFEPFLHGFGGELSLREHVGDERLQSLGAVEEAGALLLFDACGERVDVGQRQHGGCHLARDDGIGRQVGGRGCALRGRQRHPEGQLREANKSESPV